MKEDLLPLEHLQGEELASHSVKNMDWLLRSQPM